MSVLADNPDELYQELVARARLVLGEEWQPHGPLEASYRVFAQAGAEINANVNEKLEAATVETQGDLLRIPMQDGLPAQSTITVEAIDTVGYTLPVGTPVTVGGSAGSAVACLTTADLVIDAGSDTGSVGIETQEATAEFNGADGDVDVRIDWANSAILDAPLDGGVDPETAEEYRPRLASETQLLAEAIAQPADAVTFVLRDQRVGWAYALDHFNADTDADDEPLTFTVVVADADGEPVDSGVLAELDAAVQARLATNYVAFVVNATYSPIDVPTCEIVPEQGWTFAAAQANAEEALALATSPAQHIASPFGADPSYTPPTRIYATDLIAAVRNADGVRHVLPSFEIGDGSDAFIDLDGPMDLPEPGTFVVTDGS